MKIYAGSSPASGTIQEPVIIGVREICPPFFFHQRVKYINAISVDIFSNSIIFILRLGLLKPKIKRLREVKKYEGCKVM